MRFYTEEEYVDLVGPSGDVVGRVPLEWRKRGLVPPGHTLGEVVIVQEDVDEDADGEDGEDAHLDGDGEDNTDEDGEDVVLEKLTKAELVAIAEDEGVDTSGTRADLIKRLS